MSNFNQQQQPGPFPFLDEIEQRVHPVTGYVLAAVGAVGGYFYGIDHRGWPVVVFVALGLILGLLAVPLLKHLTAFLIGAALVGAAAIGTFWLLRNDAGLKSGKQSPPVQYVQPAQSGNMIDEIKKAVQR